MTMLANNLQFSVLTVNTDIPLMGLAGLGLAELGLGSAPFSVSHLSAQVGVTEAARIGSYEGWHEPKSSQYLCPVLAQSHVFPCSSSKSNSYDSKSIQDT